MLNSNGGIIDCVIRSDSPYRGSLYVSGLRGIENINNIRRNLFKLCKSSMSRVS